MEDQQPFEIVLAHLDGFVRVQLRGDLDFDATVRNAEALREVTDLRERVVLDLARIRFIDSGGLRFLTHLAVAHDGPLRLENVPRPVQRLLDLTGINEMFEVGPP